MFLGYVIMQSNFCKKDGYDDLAQRIAKAGYYELTEQKHQHWLASLHQP
jgi:hypothetical protein